MAQRLLEKKVRIDQFLASPAKRARKTAETFAKEYNAKDKVVFFQELYLASASAFSDVIRKTDKEYDTIAIFSHNPGITEFANMLADVRIDNIPTSGIFAVKVDIKSWKDFDEAEKVFWFFDYPKAGDD
jgi:phosphohistidine phosphatase